MRIHDKTPPDFQCDDHLRSQWKEGLQIWGMLTDKCEVCGGKATRWAKPYPKAEQRMVVCDEDVPDGWKSYVGHRTHPETKRWASSEGLMALWLLLYRTRGAMLRRGWNPMPMPDIGEDEDKPPDVVARMIEDMTRGQPMPEPIDDQLAVLRSKGCKCALLPEVPA